MGLDHRKVMGGSLGVPGVGMFGDWGPPSHTACGTLTPLV